MRRFAASATRPALEPAAHLTCVAATRAEIDAVARGLLAGGDPPHRGAARRSAGGRSGLRAASRRLCLCRRSRRRAQAHRRFRDQRRRLSRDPSRGAERRARPRQSEAQARRRRQPRDHPVSSSMSTSFCAFATAPRRPGSRCRSSRASCRSPISPRSESSAAPAAPRSRPGWQASSTGSTTIPTRAASSPPRSPPSNAGVCMPKACTSSISTR